MNKDQLKILTPIGMLGYGIPREFFRQGIAWGPDAICADAGSTDSGPQKLGMGAMTCSRAAYRSDLALMLEGGRQAGAPVLVSSAGGDGTNAHTDLFLDIIDEIARERGWRLRCAAIYADIPKPAIHAALEAGRIAPLGPVPPLRAAEIDAATNIVAQMGAEPFIKAMQERPDLDVIVSGRAYDPVPIAALGMLHGFPPALAWHMGKIMECGALCAEPNGRNIMGVLRHEHFELEPVNPAERCTTSSVAAHTLYEKSHPFELAGPGGTLDLSHCAYEQVTDRRVRASGAVFRPAPAYTVKLEGAKQVGFRTIFIAGARDPIFIAELDGTLERVMAAVRASFPDVPADSYQVIPHIYGRNGVMGPLEPLVDRVSHELCIIVEVAATTQDLATAICGRLRSSLLHAPYPGRLATAGNLAHPFTPLEIPLGPVCEFNVYHLMAVRDPVAPFPIRYVELG
ncbi:acyclic terpene utilization AtuA family protein [Pigmentiphaga soli]|uniref:Acyclic terpene utilization AtuA family protein n=1 Tax=Pigmentiphaga soli TaxID=1007095 RepID=A0ABP8HEF5_9BURK